MTTDDFCVWEELKMSEKEFDKYYKKFSHEDIDADTFTDLINELFPKSKEARVYAWLILGKGVETAENNSK